MVTLHGSRRYHALYVNSQKNIHSDHELETSVLQGKIVNVNLSLELLIYKRADRWELEAQEKIFGL